MRRRIVCYGASVRGPAHRLAHTPNEDAWLRAEGVYGTLIVVCDGVGSRPLAHFGARAACIAAREAVARWAMVDGAPPLYLAYLIEVLWRLRVHPHDPKDAATTCLMALAQRTGEWVVGGIGDGLAAVLTGNRKGLFIAKERGEGFCNETVGLGLAGGVKAWRMSRLPSTPHRRIAVLATDGISDDLVPRKLRGFIRWIADEFRTVQPRKRWCRLSKALRDWPTPRHLDDKSIAVLLVEAATGRK